MKFYLKLFLLGVLITILVMSTFTTVFAATETKKEITITYREIKVSVDGEELIFTNLEGEILEPFLAFDTVYVSASAAARALGKNSQFVIKDNILKINGSGKAVPVKNNTAGTSEFKNVTIKYSNIRIFLDGGEVTLKDMEGRKQEPFMAFDTVYVPLTALARALGKTTSVIMGKEPEKPTQESTAILSNSNDWLNYPGSGQVWTANKTSAIIHRTRDCSNMKNPVEWTKSGALARNVKNQRPCEKCWINRD